MFHYWPLEELEELYVTLKSYKISSPVKTKQADKPKSFSEQFTEVCDEFNSLEESLAYRLATSSAGQGLLNTTAAFRTCLTQKALITPIAKGKTVFEYLADSMTGQQILKKMLPNLLNSMDFREFVELAQPNKPIVLIIYL